MKKKTAMILAALWLFPGCTRKTDGIGEAARARIASLEAQTKTLEAQVRTLSAQNEEARRGADSLLREKSGLESKVAALASENDRLTKEIAGTRAAVAEDTEYLVTKREYIPGKLIDKTPPRVEVTNTDTFQTHLAKPITNMGRDWERSAPVWRIYLRGVQTHRDYPPLEVKESEYRNFIEGAVYTRADLNRAKVQ